MNLPEVFTRNIHLTFKEKGEAWLADLPRLLQCAADKWKLTLGEPFLLSYNYVCAATRADGTPAVLKIGVPNNELTSEILTLQEYGGVGACRLYEADPEAGMLLLERLVPGQMLLTVKEDEKATAIAAEVMSQTHRPVPAKASGFLSLRGWFSELKNVRKLFHGGTGPFPEKSFSLAESLIQELFAEDRPDVLLHGDFHHYNILSSERGWLIIDPKGVVGPAEYDVTPFMMNPEFTIPEETEGIRRTQRRIAIFAEHLGFDRQRLLNWCISFSVLSSYWDMQEDGGGGESARAWTEIFIKTRV